MLLGRSIWSDALRTWRNTRWRLQFTAKPRTCDTGITNTVNDFTFFHLLQVGQWVYYDDYWAHNFARNKKQQGIERFANCRGYPSQTGRDYVHNRNRNSVSVKTVLLSICQRRSERGGKVHRVDYVMGITPSWYTSNNGGSCVRLHTHTHARATHTHTYHLWGCGM